MAKPRFYYDNRLADAAPAASSTAAGDFNVANLLDFRPYTWWKPGSMPATVTTDCGSSKAADYALCYGHDLGSKGATLEIRGSTDNFGASNVLVATVTPTSDLPVLLSFNSASYRYWRGRVTGANAPSIAILSIGAALEAPVFFDGQFDPIGRNVEGQTNRNEDGQPVGRIVYFETWKYEILLPNVPWSWARGTFMPAWKSHLRGSPFAFCWEAALYPEDVVLVQAGDRLSTPHRAGSFCDVQFGVMGVAL